MRNSILKQAAVILLTSVSLPALAQDQSEALRAAYEQYAAARIAMSQAEAGSPEAAAQADAAINAQTTLTALCTDLGAPDMAACFDQFLPPEIRVPNDLDAIAPVATPKAEEPAPAEKPAEVPAQTPAEVPVEKPLEQPAQQPAEQPAAPPPEAPAPQQAPEIPADAAAQPAPAAAPAPTPAEKPAAIDETTKKKLKVPAATQPEAVVEPKADAQPAEDMAGKDVKPEEVAPLLDSAKEETAPEAPVANETPEQKKKRLDRTKDRQNAQPVAQEPAAPAPKSDAEAQAKVEPQKFEAVEAEKGTVVEDQQKTRRQRAANAPEAAQQVQQDQNGLRIVFQFGDQLLVENQDSTRLTGKNGERTIEDLRRGRTRETITRQNGSKVVTIYNRNGDILRRSRFTPEGREIVMVSVSEDRESDLLEWRDPGRDLPPLRLSIPARDYVMDADQADERQVIDFLDQPPVESVRRLYSIDEVKRSARIRDSVRRLEIGGLTFNTGKATISPDQVGALTNTAKAMLRMLDDNPAETFLIEGHTDAVGSDISNLDLSDRRAETIAIVLSDVYDIPPENLTTQGYGERYLKVRTEDAERLNRRVTVRRITPLVAPVANR